MFGLWNRKRPDVLKHWYSLLENFQCDTTRFYGAVEVELQTQRVPGLTIESIEFAEGGALSANRLYLRGLPPKVIVDLARVRLTGREKGTTNRRTPPTRADSLRVGIERRFAEAIDMIESEPQGAIRALTLLQVEVLASSPGFASAVGEAVLAMRRGRDATVPLLRARRTLSGDPAGTSGLPAWSDGW